MATLQEVGTQILRWSLVFIMFWVFGSMLVGVLWAWEIISEATTIWYFAGPYWVIVGVLLLFLLGLLFGGLFRFLHYLLFQFDDFA